MAFTTKLKFYMLNVINLNYANNKIQYMFLLSALIDFYPEVARKNYLWKFWF